MLKIAHTKPVIASSVEIPERYFNRMLTGIDVIDSMFGGGVMPGSTITCTAAPGTGKTTLFLQVCSALIKVDKRAAYVSGEEDIFMLALACRRLNTQDVKIASQNRLSEILNIISENDFVVIDSCSRIVYDLADADELSDRQKDERKVIEIMSAASLASCTCAIILHMTKAGSHKGANSIQHDVDVNIKIQKSDINPLVREFEVSKNRFGPTGDYSLYMQSTGYDFYTSVADEDSSEEMKDGKGRKRKKSAKERDCDAILAIDKQEFTLEDACAAAAIDEQRAKFLLWQLTNSNALTKSGRGEGSTWTKSFE